MKEPTKKQLFDMALSNYGAAVIRTEQARVNGSASHHTYYRDELVKRNVVLSMYESREDSPR